MAIKSESAEYRSDSTVHKGHLAYDDAVTGKRPGVLVIPEWWGVNKHTHDSAHRLAEAGYVALVLDMYGNGQQVHQPDEAAKLSGDLMKNSNLLKSRFEAGMKFLRDQPRVDASNVAAIGYCFGGSVVLEMARAGVNLRGVASFHGGLGTQNSAKPGIVKARVLVMNGADDPFVPADQVAAFKKEMEAARVECKIVNYPGAKHGFTNPAADANAAKFKLPLAYDAKVDRESWTEMLTFMKSVFR